MSVYILKYDSTVDILCAIRKDITEEDNDVLIQESFPIGDLVLDFDADGNLCGFELLNASKVVSWDYLKDIENSESKKIRMG